MRPLVLKVSGFTAFRTEQTLDLRGLDLFAIAGPTGAGKSSLLDAMTYALYGEVERVGHEVGQLIAQGMSGMAVTLEFALGERAFRVGRRTPRRGAATAILEERAGENREWVAIADKSRDVNAAVRRLLGLDYATFTRAVLLPQGRFDQFLKGDARRRRDILTELLDLGLFDRMAKVANERARGASAGAAFTRELIEREYASATVAARDALRESLAAACLREVALRDAEGAVGEVLIRERAAVAGAATQELLAQELRAAARIYHDAAEKLRDLAAAERPAKVAALEAERVAAGAVAAAGVARRAREAAERRWGALPPMFALRGRALRLGELREAAREAGAARDSAASLVPALASALRAATLTAERAAAAHETARAALDRAEHADVTGAIALGLRKGDPCPVCGSPLTATPKRATPAALGRARAAATAAASAADRAAELRRGSEREAEAAARELVTATRAAETADTRVGVAERELGAAFAGRLPRDPLAVLDGRITELERLIAAESATSTDLRTAEQGQRAAAAEEARIAAAVAVGSERGAPDRAVALHARLSALDVPSVAPLPKRPAATGVTARSAYADAVSRALDTAARTVTERATGADGDTFLAEARRVAGAFATVGARATTVQALSVALATAARDAARAASGTEATLETMTEQIERRGALEVEARALDTTAARHHALATDLKADRIVDFLQGEALRLLAGAASAHLARLSGDRYRLAYRDDEFVVIDVWNGEEERSVRTLSGSETFLASLALAVALADEVRTLAVTERARLDSLFLDEGFGSLDAETLGQAVAALDRLGDDGRMVGVITHVREMAEQFPCIEVTKSPSGSRVDRLGPPFVALPRATGRTDR